MTEQTVTKGASYRLGIDIGGTFTDLSAVDSETGKQIELKTPTIPKDPARGVANGILELEKLGVMPNQIEYFVHGTTIALNALIQRSGSKVALLTTEGFRDVLEHGRIRLPIPFDFYSKRATPLVPRDLVIPVKERMRHDGIEVPLTQEEINRIVEIVKTLDVEGIAICLLHSYSNPTHEKMLKEAIEKEVPHLFVSASNDIWPQIREYERSIATVINAYVRPTLSRYLNNLETTLQELGVSVRPYLTRSNGGIMTTDAAKEVPIETLISGPASGVTGAHSVGSEIGLKNLIALDMGGTSADVAVIEDGQISFSREEQIGDFPLILPSIGISSIGAGGGSIAWLDGTGILKVGPSSAGADPGPACYGMGGTNPTISDAFLLCGYLNPNSFVGNTQLDINAATDAMRSVADPLNLTIKEAANAVIQVALANMYAELSAVLERKGIDPREFSLMAFGGAGAVVACQLAEEINISKVVIPRSPGTLCALGALQADIMSDFIKTINLPLNSLDNQRINTGLNELKELANKWLEKEAPVVVDTYLQWSCEMHYIGQSHEIEVQLEEEWIINSYVEKIASAFHEAHERLFHHSDESAPIELVNLRVRSVGIMPQPPISSPEPSNKVEESNHVRDILISGETQVANVFKRENLKPGQKIKGPLVIEQVGSTTVIPIDWVMEVDTGSNLIITKEEVNNG